MARNDQYRCKVKRAQPFRGASNDVAQVCNQCNVDFQYLPCAPLLDDGTNTGDSEPGCTSLPEPDKSTEAPQWLVGVEWGKLCPEQKKIVAAFNAAFRKMLVLDFYITMYEAKMMQVLCLGIVLGF